YREMSRQGMQIRLIHFTQVKELFARGRRVAQPDAGLCEKCTQASLIGIRKAIARSDGLPVEHLRQVDNGMPAHRESEARLTGASVVHTGDEQRACVENRSESTEPGFVIVLRAEVG